MSGLPTEKCPSCEWEGGPTALMYHLSNHHPDLLVSEPWPGFLPDNTGDDRA